MRNMDSGFRAPSPAESSSSSRTYLDREQEKSPVTPANPNSGDGRAHDRLNRSRTRSQIRFTPRRNGGLEREMGICKTVLIFSDRHLANYHVQLPHFSDLDSIKQHKAFNEPGNNGRKLEAPESLQITHVRSLDLVSRLGAEHRTIGYREFPPVRCLFHWLKLDRPRRQF